MHEAHIGHPRRFQLSADVAALAIPADELALRFLPAACKCVKRVAKHRLLVHVSKSGRNGDSQDYSSSAPSDSSIEAPSASMTASCRLGTRAFADEAVPAVATSEVSVHTEGRSRGR